MFCCLERAHVCLGGWEGAPGGGPWRGFGGVNNPQLRTCAVTLRDFCIAQNHLKMWIWALRSAAELGKSAGGRSKTVLGSSWFGPFFVLPFGITFLRLLGASWHRFGVSLASF